MAIIREISDVPIIDGVWTASNNYDEMYELSRNVTVDGWHFGDAEYLSIFNSNGLTETMTPTHDGTYIRILHLLPDDIISVDIQASYCDLRDFDHEMTVVLQANEQNFTETLIYTGEQDSNVTIDSQYAFYVAGSGADNLNVVAGSYIEYFNFDFANDNVSLDGDALDFGQIDGYSIYQDEYGTEYDGSVVFVDTTFNIATDGNDIIIVDGSADVIVAGAGDDIVRGSSSADVIYGGEGNDILRGGKGNDIIHGGDGDDTIYGNKHNNTLFGDDGNDYIHTGQHGSIVDGGDGDDHIYVSTVKNSNHILTGGSGADTFEFSAIVRRGASHSTITDFEFGHDSLIIAGEEVDVFETGEFTDEGLLISFSGNDSVLIVMDDILVG